MKKYSFLFITILSITISSIAFSSQKYIDSIKHFGQQFGADIGNYDLFYGDYGALSTESYRTWMDAFTAAENFVMNNSKNLVGVRDSDIIAALNAMKKAHTDITLTIEKIAKLQNNQQLQQMEKLLNTIVANLEASVTKLNKANLTLSNKIEARKVLNEMKNVLKWIINYKLIPVTKKRIGMV